MPALLGAEQDPIDRLRTALPPDIADEVIASVTDATSRGLPGQAIADRALEAIARGRSARKVSAAVQAFANDLARGRAALQHAGRTPDATEIEAAATARSSGSMARPSVRSRPRHPLDVLSRSHLRSSGHS